MLRFIVRDFTVRENEFMIEKGKSQDIRYFRLAGRRRSSCYIIIQFIFFRFDNAVDLHTELKNRIPFELITKGKHSVT